MKKIKFRPIIPANYKIELKHCLLIPNEIEITKITLGDSEFIPKHKMIITKDITIPIINIFDENLFMEKKQKN